MCSSEKNHIEKFNLLINMAKQCPTHEDSQQVLSRHLDLKKDYWNHCVIPQSKLPMVLLFFLC